MPTAVQPTPTIIAIPTVIAIDIAEVSILSPGDGSRVLSPLHLQAQLAAGYEGKVSIQLIDANGRLRSSQIIALAGELLDMQIHFEISRPTQAARLVVSTQDEYGRQQALNSVDLLLLSEGAQDLEPAAQGAHIEISQPRAGESLPSADLQIAGTAHGQPGRPLTIELVTREGKVLAFTEAYPDYASGETGFFSAEFELELEEPTWVQVAVWETGGGFEAPAHFKAIEVLLIP